MGCILKLYWYSHPKPVFNVFWSIQRSIEFPIYYMLNLRKPVLLNLLNDQQRGILINPCIWCIIWFHLTLDLNTTITYPFFYHRGLWRKSVDNSLASIVFLAIDKFKGYLEFQEPSNWPVVFFPLLVPPSRSSFMITDKIYGITPQSSSYQRQARVA